MTAPTPDAERVQGEVTAAVERGQGALSSHPLFGCSCCTWPEKYDEEHPDGCPSDDGYVDHNYGPTCRIERGRAEILTVDTLAAALDVEEMARAIDPRAFADDLDDEHFATRRNIATLAAQRIRTAILGGAA